MAEFDCINCCMKVVVVKYRCRIIVGDQCSSPEVKESVDIVV